MWWKPTVNNVRVDYLNAEMEKRENRITERGERLVQALSEHELRLDAAIDTLTINTKVFEDMEDELTHKGAEFARIKTKYLALLYTTHTVLSSIDRIVCDSLVAINSLLDDKSLATKGLKETDDDLKGGDF